MSKFKRKAIQDGNWDNRSSFRDNYAEFENYCHSNYGKGNFLDWASQKLPIFDSCKALLIELIQMDTIKSHNNRFQISPNIEEATNLLRHELLDPTIKSNYSKGPNRAVFELLSLIRNNLNHQNKSETEEEQYNRNYQIVRIANEISIILLDQIENAGK